MTKPIEIVIENIKENMDGSADAVIHFNSEGLKYLIQYAVIDILEKHLVDNPIVQPSDKEVKKYHASTKRKASSKT